MENKETFQMTYSAEVQQEVRSIRQKYAPRQPDRMEQLRALDAAVNRRATVPALTVGVLGALLLGLGMSLVLSELGAALGALALPAGVIVGVLGLAVLACAYPLYLRTLRREREKAAPEILRLSDELLR